MARPKALKPGKPTTIFAWNDASKKYEAFSLLPDGSLPVGGSDLTVRIDDVGSGIKYIGKAAPGTATSASTWQVFRLDSSASPDLTKLYADGVAAFTKRWDDRATYTYST